MDNQTKLSLLKKKLSEELQKENSDNDLILSLSNEIAKLDEHKVRFSVDAGIINRLGKELVARHETAVSELVKNSYDADALKVQLIFENTRDKGGKLYIVDDGVGMTRKQLINGFMRLSSADKLKNPISSRYNRLKAGRKGIGRFATQRIGNKLTIITQTLDAEKAIKVEIDWEDFAIDKELSMIKNQIESVPKIREEGTTLIIDDLRDAWTDAMIKRAYRYTNDLLQPFPLSKRKKETEEKRVDPGFKSSYFRKEGDELIKIVDEEEAFYKHALAEIEGYVLEDGHGFWSMKSKKLNFPEEIFLIGKEKNDENAKFKYIRNVHFKCYYFIFESSLLPAKTLSFFKSVANERGGIRLYRNGFRVLPYGEKGDDWLGLDESTRRRSIIVPHQNISFFGFTEITDESGVLFEETSSREGLIENDALDELIDFVYRCITSAVLKVAELRKRKGTAAQKDWQKPEKPEDIVDAAISDLDEIAQKSAPSIPEPAENFRVVLDRLKESRKQEKEARYQLIEENNMLRVLAGLGLVIGEFVHEIQRFLPAFNTDIEYLKNVLKDAVDSLERVERLDDNLKGFTTYTAYFYESISRNVLRELESIELRDIVYDFEKVIQNDINRSGYTFHKPVFEDYDLWTIPMHKSEWASILFNFYINSKKAIRRAGIKGEIFIRCGRENDIVFLEFSDNGDGIQPEHEEKIFDAFFTTTSAAGRDSSEEESLTGIGLGLKIVRDIVESYGGEIYLTSPPEGFRTTFRIEIPEEEETESDD